jgi:hypothetical protein
MDDLVLRRSCRLARRITAGLLLWLVHGASCLAFEMPLPNVGTSVNYDFLTETPEFEIVANAATQEALQSQVWFADNKHLRTTAEADLYLVHINLILRSPGIAELFEPILNPFDETLRLLGRNGESVATTTNSSRSDSNSDEYQIGWDFNFASDVSFYGFDWALTPSLRPGKVLPDTMTLAMNISAAGEVRVVPEPSCIKLALTFVACIAALFQRARFRLSH